MTVEHLDFLAVQSGKEAVLLDFHRYFVTESIVHAAHTHLIAVDTKPLVLMHTRLHTLWYEYPWLTKHLLLLSYLKGEHVAVQNVVAGIAV